MAFRPPSFRAIAKDFGAALQDFQRSNSSFRVLKTIRSSTPISQDASTPTSDETPRTLFILDSSFNPPSIAHRSLAIAALRNRHSVLCPKPHRLLLLFATRNADKAPSAAEFAERLTLMSAFATDLIESLATYAAETDLAPVDIGVTTVPFFIDKTAAIEREGTHWYRDRPKHVHLVGYDTLTRIFTPKYYTTHDPPLSALAPYFQGGHRLSVTLRPRGNMGDSEAQKSFVTRLAAGSLETAGASKEWADQIEVNPPSHMGDISSTRIRKAANREDWAEVSRLTTRSVADCVRSNSLYGDDDSGAKTA